MIKWDLFPGHKPGLTFIKKKIKVIHHISKRKTKNHMILSLDAEKAFDKIKHPFLIKTLQSAGIEGIFLVILKAIYKSPRQISFSMGKH